MKTGLLALNLGETVRTARFPEKDKYPGLNNQINCAGALDAIKKAKFNFWVVGISNQGGIECGHKTLESCFAEMLQLSHMTEGLLDMLMFCPEYNGAGGTCYYLDTWVNEWVKIISRRNAVMTNPVPPTPVFKSGAGFRMPDTGMLRLAMALYEVHDLERVIYVGDLPTDREMAENAGVRFMDALDWRNPKNNDWLIAV